MFLLSRFFEEYPDNQDFFTEFRDLNRKELRDSTGLQQHAMRVMRALACIVDSIDDAHVLISVLHKTVDSHLTRGIRVSQFTVSCSCRVLVFTSCASFHVVYECWHVVCECPRSVRVFTSCVSVHVVCESPRRVRGFTSCVNVHVVCECRV